MIARRRAEPVGGRLVTRGERPARTVTIDGQDYVIVWDGHRDGLSLLPAEYPAVDGERDCSLLSLHRALVARQLRALQDA